MEKYVYLFTEGNENMKELLGGKGANLAGMTNIGLNVPFGFTITTEACNMYLKNNCITPEIKSQIKEALTKVEAKTGKKFGDAQNPLLLSIRSGARKSMPGMLETILNLGLNEETVQSMIKKTNNPTFVYDIYRRFIMMFANVAKNIDEEIFISFIDNYKTEKDYHDDLEMTADDWKFVAEKFLYFYEKELNEQFPTDPFEQLLESINAVFRSWNNQKAVSYRSINNIPNNWGTAVNVQTMVFGNTGSNSATGVLFSRNVANGVDELYGEYLINAQGEDVVAGVRTPKPILDMKSEERFSKLYDDIYAGAKTLENYFKDVQDMEITIEDGELFFLQTRTGKRTANAALKIAMDLYSEGLNSKEETVMMIDPEQIEMILHPNFLPEQLKKATVLGKGLPASPGAAVGQIYFNPEDAVNAKSQGKDVILVRHETSPEDIMGMNAAKGILTVRGGMTSHAAVVARGMGKCCVSGCETIHLGDKKFKISGKTFREGDFISINGTTGEIYAEKLDLKFNILPNEYFEFMKLVDEFRKIKVRANAETKNDVEIARKLKAEGVGLVRTEHMFFETNKIKEFRKMIIANTVEDIQTAGLKIRTMQTHDFEEIFRVMHDMKVTIRLLDPPLHEFLPKDEENKVILANELNMSFSSIDKRIEALSEANPMMGLRGCRLSVAYPNVTKMQLKAITDAYMKTLDCNIELEIMIPLVNSATEVKYLTNMIREEIKMIDPHGKMKYKLGTMIEVPRAALRAGEIAKYVDFFSFGTNDLTQFTYAISRDDANEFMNVYLENEIYEVDPTIKLDTKGVGKLMEISVRDGRETNPELELGICGEHGGEPDSVQFCCKTGLDYVSCSPFRIPVAKLAAAQYEIKK